MRAWQITGAGLAVIVLLALAVVTIPPLGAALKTLANYGSFWVMVLGFLFFVGGAWWDLGPGAEQPFSHEEVSHIGCFVAILGIVLIILGVIWTLVGRFLGFVTWTIPLPAWVVNFGAATPTPPPK